jgi:hypothetical protein
MKITVAITVMGLFALLFWQTIMDTTGNDTAVAGPQPKPEYLVPFNPYLPIKSLRPTW